LNALEKTAWEVAVFESGDKTAEQPAAFRVTEALDVTLTLFGQCLHFVALNRQALVDSSQQSQLSRDRLLSTRSETGIAEGAAKSLLLVLTARGFLLAEEQRQRILDCTNVELLNSWLQKAAMLTDVGELFT
jgi:hypothetical protein